MKLFTFLKQILKEFNEDKASQLSAASAYISIFAIGPLLLVLISVVGFVFGEKAASGQLFSQLSGIVGADAAKSIQDTIATTHQSGKGILALLVGVVGTLLAASGLSNQLQSSFDIIFDAVPDPKSGIKRTFYTKLKNISLLIGVGLVVIISVLASTIIAALGNKVQEYLGVPAPIIEMINSGLSLVVFITILYIIYKVLPDVRIPKKIALDTAMAISLLFLVGKIVLGIIIGRNGTANAYGAAASLITLLLWFYYIAQILLLGAEGIKVYGDNHALVYKAKKYTLKRRTINLDVKDHLLGRSLEKFAQGVKKATRPKK